MNSVLFLLAFFIYANRVVNSHESHAMCKPRLTVIQVQKEFPKHDFFPFFVKAYRCDGSCHIHPSEQKCSVVTEQDIRIPLFDRINSKQVVVTITNHTGCACACVKSPMDCRQEVEDWNQDQCRCTCKYPKAPPKDLACKAGFRWDKYMCRCKCDTPPKACPPRQEWNRDACSCTCSKRIISRCERKQKGLDYVNCECVDVQALRRDPAVAESKSRVYISFLVVQGIVILGLTCVLIHLIVKSQRQRLVMTYNNEVAPPPLKTPPSIADSGNISCSNGSVNVNAQASDVKTDHHTNSNGSVCFTSQLSRESTL